MKYYCDGYTRGTQKRYGGGFCVMREDGELIAFEQMDIPGVSSLEFELKAIQHAVSICEHNDQVSTDTMFLVSQLLKRKIKIVDKFTEDLQKTAMLIKEKNINLMWEGRRFNLAGIYNEQKLKERIKLRIAQERNIPNFMK